MAKILFLVNFYQTQRLSKFIPCLAPNLKSFNFYTFQFRTVQLQNYLQQISVSRQKVVRTFISSMSLTSLRFAHPTMNF